MTADRHCCCLDIKTCGLIVGVLGTLIGVSACAASLHNPNPFAWALFLLATYMLIVVGITKNNTCWLLTAEIFLGLQIAVHIIPAFFILFCLGFGARDISRSIYWQIQTSISPRVHMNNFHNFEEYNNSVQVTIAVLVVAVIAMSIFFIYSCVVVLRARKLIEEENDPKLTPFPQYNMPPPPMHVNLYGSHVPQQSFSAPVVPQGYYHHHLAPLTSANAGPQHYPHGYTNNIPLAPPQHLHHVQAPAPMIYAQPPHLPHGYPTGPLVYPNLNSGNAPSCPTE